MPPTNKSKSNSTKKTGTTLSLDANRVVSDQLFIIDSLEKFLLDHIKVEGRINNLEGTITLSKKGNVIVLQSTKPFTKRYLKYLTKKFLQKNQIGNFTRVLAKSPTSYHITYPSLDTEKDDEADD